MNKQKELRLKVTRLIAQDREYDRRDSSHLRNWEFIATYIVVGMSGIIRNGYKQRFQRK